MTKEGRSTLAGCKKLYTFDVFETLIARALSPHDAIFLEVGRTALQRNFIQCSPSVFARTRAQAEIRASKINGAHSTLSHIYDELMFMLNLTPDERDHVSSVELGVELATIRAIPAAYDLLGKARLDFGRAVFISDMYLPTSFIKELLEKVGLWLSTDRLYVSNEYGCTKRSGKLFKVVAANEGVPVKTIIHYGNHPEADVAGADRAGARGVLLNGGNSNRYEKALERQRFETDGVSAAFAGASRLARLNATGSATDALIDVSTGVIGPVLTCYVLWVFKKAQAKGLKRLYFVSRDGEILLRVAERLRAKLGLDVELRYLYGSRLVWNRAVSSPTLNPQIWRSLMHVSSKGVPNRALLERIGLPDAVKDRLLAATGCNTGAWDHTTDRSILELAVHEITTNGELESARLASKGIVVDYLRQEGLFDSVPSGFVDVGWRGTQHDVLLELQREQGAQLAFGLFFGLEAANSPWNVNREAYYFDTRPKSESISGPISRDIYYSAFELFCAGSVGTLIGYEYDEANNICPILDPGREREVEKWGLKIVHQVVADFALHLELSKDLAFSITDISGIVSAVTELFWFTPTREEAIAWGSYPWENGQGAQRTISDFAPSLPDLKSSKSSPAKGLHTQWKEGSWVRSSVKDRLLNKPKVTIRRVSSDARRRAIRKMRKAVNNILAK